MSTSEEAQLPSFNALRAAHQPPRLFPDMRRLFWTLDGPLAESIWIMENANNPDSLEPYFNGEEQSWHTASNSPLTEPKVSSITVHVNDLDDWEDNWLDCHRDHSDPDCGDEARDENGKLMVQWGELPDYDSDEDEEGQPGHLLMCCGTRRPRGKAASVVVKPATEAFVTVHDYLSTVHPWLVSVRDDLLSAMGLWDDKPLPPETRLMVNYDAADSLKMYDRPTWIILRRNKPSQRLLDSVIPQ
ncbi:hypothetical protein F4677DRAFT_60727 [Hypoxylon crocopeplum]|nr:hypothetical protein F4677DRAFT_60727 [Hypoxylon crocopeplum]